MMLVGIWTIFVDHSHDGLDHLGWWNNLMIVDMMTRKFTMALITLVLGWLTVGDPSQADPSYQRERRQLFCYINVFFMLAIIIIVFIIFIHNFRPDHQKSDANIATCQR